LNSMLIQLVSFFHIFVFRYSLLILYLSAIGVIPTLGVPHFLFRDTIIIAIVDNNICAAVTQAKIFFVLSIYNVTITEKH
jgi:hypothetical protein